MDETREQVDGQDERDERAEPTAEAKDQRGALSDEELEDVAGGSIKQYRQP